MPEAFILGFGGGAQWGSASDLAADAVRTGVGDARLELGDVDRLILATTVPSVPEELSLAPAVARTLGICPQAFGVSFGEASGLLAIVQAAEAITTGAAHVVVAGGADTPSRVPYWVPGLRRGPALDTGIAIDPLPAARLDPQTVHALDCGDRAAQDAFAQRSHERAKQPTRSAEELAALKPIHSPDGTITVGNSAAQVDGAWVAVLAHRAGEIAVAGSSLIGNGGTTPEALAEAVRAAAGTTAPGDLIAIELHESSAALCLATADQLGVDPLVLNREGGEIATGSAGAASGALMVQRACRQLETAPRPGRAVVAAVGPGGQAIAVALDRRT